MRMIYHSLACASVLLALCACADQPEGTQAPSEQDPLIQQALNDQLMVDPDLAFQTEGNTALTIGFDHSLPPVDTGPDIIAIVRDEARMALLDKGEIPDLPEPASKRILSLSSAHTAAGRASIVSPPWPCADRMSYSTIWAARLPEYAEIVPRGAVVEAAGFDESKCKLRSVTYRTPLPVEDVALFHFAQAHRAGLKPAYYRLKDGEVAIRGTSKSARLAVYARPTRAGLNSVDVVSLEIPGRAGAGS